eukprot:TRINITY_DN3131_c0_g1_i1.p1 TRINITY_DN3131_c0_g1~~TRINITY_DN3131_c0_g1_i1.p1  ORF type:complete len:578 (-),score=92.79 TRINITY_DN3131_c0_g1_i1:177-1910(-)
MCNAQPVSHTVNAKSNATLSRHKRSKLQQLKRLQRATRLLQKERCVQRGVKRHSTVECTAARKRSKNSEAVVPAALDVALVSAAESAVVVAADSVVRSESDGNTPDAASLRAELQLRIEDDPYGDCPAPVKSFDELPALPSYVLRSLQRNGITAPMPIQAQALPLVLSGRDVIGLAQTGSGKTLAFLLPAAVHLEKQELSKQSSTPAPFVLVLAPTRELAVQIADEAGKVFDTPENQGWNNQVHTVAVYGGGDKWKQQKQLRWGAHIVVATPGRLADFVTSNVLSLNRVTYLVLDEADRMLDMGFHDDVENVAKRVQAKRQVLFFSATWGDGVQKLAQGLCSHGSKPVRISYGQDRSGDVADLSKQKAREGIVQEVVVVDHVGADHWEKQEAEKDAIMEKHLTSVLSASEEHKVLVFVSQKQKADKLSTRLQEQGFKVDAMHGGKSQDYRLWVLDQFRQGKLRLLVCTDVLGRGIDIPSVSHVVIHEMGEIEDYVHRIGRTARGKHGKGHALVFFEYWDGSPQIASNLIDLLRASKQPVPAGLQTIADEVASGKRQVRGATSTWKSGGGWKKSAWSS